MVFSCNLVYLRGKRGWSMQKVADHFDICRYRYAKWEEGKSAPNYDWLIRLAEFFGVTIDDLLTKYLSYGTDNKAA